MKHGQIISLVVILIIIFYSCGENIKDISPKDNLPTETVKKLRTRQQSLQKIIESAHAAQEINAKAFYYNTLANFQSGNTEMPIERLANLAGKKVEFLVLYEILAPWGERVANSSDLSQTGDETIDGMLEAYGMSITKKFELDDNIDGLVVTPDAILEDAVQVAKELSEIDYVVMVQVKEVPTEEDNYTSR